jgi:hypothetical protein
MKNKAMLTPLIKTVVLLPFFFLAMASCSDHNAALKWTEDVLLPDGRTVTLKRYQEFKGPHELGSTPTVSDYWFEFKHPDTGQLVRWESDRDLVTLALMMDSTAPVLLVKPAFGGVYRYGCPNPPYLLYRFDASQWQKFDIGRVPNKRVKVNMTEYPKERRELIVQSKNHLTVQQTQNVEYNYRPYVIDFNLMTQQTFATTNCSKQFDYLIEK